MFIAYNYTNFFSQARFFLIVRNSFIHEQASVLQQAG